MKKLNLLFIPLLFNILIGCGSKTKENIAPTNNDSIKQIPVDTIATPNWNGIYTNEFGGTLTISNYKENDGFEFKIYVVTNTASEDICTGEITGKAVLEKPNKASFDLKEKDTECHLSFIFDGKNSIEVNESDCISMHGGECGFEGTYKK